VNECIFLSTIVTFPTQSYLRNSLADTDDDISADDLVKNVWWSGPKYLHTK